MERVEEIRKATEKAKQKSRALQQDILKIRRERSMSNDPADMSGLNDHTPNTSIAQLVSDMESKSPGRHKESHGGFLKNLGHGGGDTLSSFWGSRRGSENVFPTDAASASVVKAHKTGQVIRKVTEESVMGEEDD